MCCSCTCFHVAVAISILLVCIDCFCADVLWFTLVVNRLNIGSRGSESSKGQAFVIEMSAAWHDWVAVGAPGANAAVALRAGHTALVACSARSLLAM